jgi:hypothetical protein
LMKLATVHCPNPACGCIYETAMDDGQWHAKCPDCLQENRVPGNVMGKEITGRCDGCGRPLDDHMHSRDGRIACPPKGKK